MKVIFLDIDGPLTTRESYNSMGPNGYVPFDHIAVHYLNSLLASSGAKIVISSNWRFYHDMNSMAEIFKKEGVKGDVISFIPTVRHSRDRGAEIKEWLRVAASVCKIQFVIIDDDVLDIEPYFPDNLIHAKGKSGLTGMQARLAVNILEKEAYHVPRTKSAAKADV